MVSQMARMRNQRLRLKISTMTAMLTYRKQNRYLARRWCRLTTLQRRWISQLITYPTSDADGHFHYKKAVPLAEISKKFKEVFNDDDLHLEKRVVYIHGVPESMDLPDTIQGAVGKYDQHTTLPIAVGKIVEA